MIVIVSPTEQQAELAARQLELAPKQWRRARTRGDLDGQKPSNIVVVLPDPTYGQEFRPLMSHVQFLEHRFRERCKEVWT